MHPFEFQHRTRLICGDGSVERLGTLASELGCSRLFVVSDSGVVKAGHFARGRDSIVAAGLQWTSFHDLHPNPTTDDVNAALALARDFKPDLIVGLGGGSSMDCAKGLNFLYCCGGQMQDYQGIGKATSNLLPMIAVPTTAGTGSEAQSFALISDAVTHVKMACGDRRTLPAISILDPVLTLTQPAQITALTGIDALTHALESSVTRTANPMSIAFAAEAWRLMAPAFNEVLKLPEDLELRSAMQLGAYLSGMAIESSMLGAAHALANPLTAAYDIPHGQAVGLMMPHVIRANAADSEALLAYDRLAGDLERSQISDEGLNSAERIAQWFKKTLLQSGLKTKLQELDVASSDLDTLAQQATTQWTLQHNPIRFNQAELAAIYQAAF